MFQEPRSAVGERLQVQLSLSGQRSLSHVKELVKIDHARSPIEEHRPDLRDVSRKRSRSRKANQLPLLNLYWDPGLQGRQAKVFFYALTTRSVRTSLSGFLSVHSAATLSRRLRIREELKAQIVVMGI